MSVAVLLVFTQLLQASSDMRVAGVQALCLEVCVERVADLVVACLVESAQVIPYFQNIRIETDGSGIRVERVAVLRNLVVEDTNRAPERGVARVAIDGLLERFVRRVEIRANHVDAPKVVPRVSVQLVNFERLQQILCCDIKVLLESLGIAIFGQSRARFRFGLRIQATQLLQDFGVLGVDGQNIEIGISSTYPILLQLQHQANLEPYIWLSQWLGRIVQNVLETLQGQREFALVLVYDAQPEIDLI